MVVIKSSDSILIPSRPGFLGFACMAESRYTVHSTNYYRDIMDKVIMIPLFQVGLLILSSFNHPSLP